MWIYIFGLGQIGLPMACWIAMSGKTVYGVDIDIETVNQIKSGNVNKEEDYIQALAKKLIESKRLIVDTKFIRDINSKCVFIICEKSTENQDGTKDISLILSAIDKIKASMVEDDLIILSTTQVPNTCENIILPKLNEAGVNFNFAYCPETIMENNICIIGAKDTKSYKLTKEFFDFSSKRKVYHASDIKTAEMAKIVQDIKRDVDIAFSNEISDAASALDIDFNELQKLINKNTKVNHLHQATEVEGCFSPNALGYLKPALKNEKNFLMTLSETANKLNRTRPIRIMNTIINALNEAGKPLKGSIVAVIGLASKDYCADYRYSPVIDLIKLLQQEGAIVKAYDPLVPVTYQYQTETFDDCIKDADCLVITTNQKSLKYEAEFISSLMSNPPIIIDTVNVIKQLKNIKVYKL